MSLKKEIAATIRAIRTHQGLDYGDLAHVSVKANIGALEQGKSNITLKKLDDLSTALGFDLVALLTICVALRNEESVSTTLARAEAQLDSFLTEGGEELLREHLPGNELVKRPPGKPKNTKNLDAVRKLRDAGSSQAEAAEKLGLAKSTVHRYWKS